jgi:hypothetical protein
MKRLLLVATLILVPLLPRLALAESLTISDNNSSIKFTRDDPTSNLGTPSDPVQLARTVEWTVDGRRILVYPSSPANMADIGHLHFGAHVRANQIHAQGPMLGNATGPINGGVTGGIVYSLDGGPAGSGMSRISEKVDIHNKTTGDLPVLLAGLGFKPPQANLEVPDFNGLDVTGTTLIFLHGNAQTDTLTEPPTFAPLAVQPAITFTGFNPLLNQSLTIPAGGTLTMVTELKVNRAPLLFTVSTLWWLLAVIVIAGGGAMLVRRRSQRR